VLNNAHENLRSMVKMALLETDCETCRHGAGRTQ